MSRAIELARATPRSWAEHALEDPDALLSDHAHCELGAAASAQGLIARYPGEATLVDRLSALAAEEMRHFRRVHALLVQRGGALAAVRNNDYAVRLVRAIDRGQPDALLERLLVAGLIERRSLERFELLAEAAAERPERADLARLYRELGPSEAGHARLFVDLATHLFPGADVAGRLAVWERREAEVLFALPFAAAIHSGLPASGPRVQESTAGVETGLSAATGPHGERA